VGEKVLTKIDNNDIFLIFDVGNKRYAALKNTKIIHDEDIYFVQVIIDEKGKNIFIDIPKEDLDIVINEYEKYIDFMDSEDEIDIEEEV